MAKLYAKAPDGSDALLSIVITGFTQSLQQNGWCKLPNGLLLQWLRSGNTSSALPINFIQSALNAVAHTDYSNSKNAHDAIISTLSLTTIAIQYMGFRAIVIGV